MVLNVTDWVLSEVEVDTEIQKVLRCSPFIFENVGANSSLFLAMA